MISLLAAGSLAAAGAAGQQTIFVTTSADVVDVPNGATIDDLPGPDGMVSFREALRASDNTAGRQTVGFEIPEERWYLPHIFPGQVLIQGSQSWSAREPVTIDGTTQTAYTGDTYPDGNEVMIYGLSTYLNGDGSIATGLHSSRIEFNGSNNDIYGNTGGMFIALYFGTGTVVHDNEAETININWGHENVIVRNTTIRVRITGGGGAYPQATGNRIGGPDAADRNFITGFGNYGEHGFPAGTTVELYGTEDTLIQNNYIGTTPDGMDIGNRASTAGIGVYTNNNNLTIRDNLIAISARHAQGGGHYGAPIYLSCYEGGDGIYIYGNTLGLNADGEPLLGGLHGIWVDADAVEWATNVHIGGPEPGQGNVIAGHWSTGVLMYNGPGIPPAGGIRVSGNSIYANGEIGIDLMPNTWDFGPTPNDPLDADMGANGLQNYPVLTDAVNDGLSIHITGTLHSEPLMDYTVEFFASPECDPSGFGQGEVFVGAAGVSTDNSGNATFDVILPATIPSGWVLTSTATLEPVGATSEFSACIPIGDSGEAALLTDMQVVTGTLLGGTISDLLASDDAYVHTRSGFGRSLVDLHHMEMIVSAETAVASPTAMSLAIESHIDEPAGTAQIRLRNWTTGMFEPVGQYAIGNVDAAEQIGDIDTTSYVDPSGRIDLSIRHIVFVPFLAFTFESFVDQVEMNVR